MSTYNPFWPKDPGIPVSPLSIKSLLNWSPRVCAHVMLWFDPASGSHLNIGYISSDPAIIAKQVSTMKACGVDFAVLEWYGTKSHPCNEAALQWKSECEKQGLNFAIGFDGGAFKPWDMPSGTTMNAWATQEMQYIVSNFFSSPAYEKTADGRFFMINFGWELVSGLTPATVMAQFPQVAMLWENSSGTGRPLSAGAYAWVGVSSANTKTAMQTYTSDFLSRTASAFAANKKLLIMGSLCKGFDDHGRRPGLDPTKSCWDQTMPYRLAEERQGQSILDTIALYNQSTFKPQYLQLVTWTDHEEGTYLEWGIDSQVTATLTATNGVLTTALTGNLNTVDHVDLCVNGQIVATHPTSPTFDLNTLNPQNNQVFTCQAIVVGKPLFVQKTSNSIATTAVIVPTQTAQLPVNKTVSVPVVGTVPVDLNTQVPVDLNTQVSVPVNGPVSVPVSASFDVPVSGTVQGLTVSGLATVPVQQNVTVQVNQSVNVPVQATVQVPVQQTVQVPVNTTAQVPVSATVTVVITAQTLWQ